MKTKTILTALAVIACCAAVNANDAYKKAHKAWLEARGKYYDYVAKNFPAGIELTKKVKECEAEIAKAKTELCLADPKLKELYGLKQKAIENYKADKVRDNKNALTIASRNLEAAWKSSEAIKSDKYTSLVKKLNGLNGQWRRVYIDARAKDPKAKEIWDKYMEAAKAKDAAKKVAK